MDSSRILSVCFVVIALFDGSESHGRLLVPPARSTMWREGFKSPIEYTDNGNNCGGSAHQWTTNEGKCGFCGDPYELEQPRPLEHGGKFGLGIITRQYIEGQQIEIQVEVTAPHMGYFQFHICSMDGKPWESEECFNEHPLSLAIGSTLYTAGNMNEIHKIVATLPPDLTCDHCVLRWKWHTGNSWGVDPNTGESGIGYGPQEEFYGCSDIQIITEAEAGTDEVLRFSTPEPTTTLATTTQPPITTFCKFNDKIHLGISIPNLDAQLNDLCQCACEQKTALCSSALCYCTTAQCLLYGAIGNFRNVNNSNAWCNTECEKGEDHCPFDKCDCFVMSSAPLSTQFLCSPLLLFSVFFLFLLQLNPFYSH